NSSVTGRPRGARTPNLRFWRPLLYQLSYWPASAAKACKCNALPPNSLVLLGLAMQRVLALMTAELLQLELLRHGLLVLVRRVIPTLALGALQHDDFSSLARHSLTSNLMEPSTRFELVTPSLPRTCSTPELRGLVVRRSWFVVGRDHDELPTTNDARHGAGDGIRTRDQQLGRL